MNNEIEHVIDGPGLSRHLIHVGYDAAARSFFCVVSCVRAPALVSPDSDVVLSLDAFDVEPVYASLDDPALRGAGGRAASVEHFVGVARRMGLDVPGELWRRLGGLASASLAQPVAR